MERLPGFNVANLLEKRGLLLAINCVAALSIFFFGYDQVRSDFSDTTDLASSNMWFAIVTNRC